MFLILKYLEFKTLISFLLIKMKRASRERVLYSCLHSLNVFLLEYHHLFDIKQDHTLNNSSIALETSLRKIMKIIQITLLALIGVSFCLNFFLANKQVYISGCPLRFCSWLFWSFLWWFNGCRRSIWRRRWSCFRFDFQFCTSCCPIR